MIYRALCVTICLLVQVSGQNYTEVTRLITDKLTGYDRRLRPISDQSQPLQVSLAMVPLAILEVDSVKEALSSVALFEIAWKDDLMVWSPASYDNVTDLNVFQSDVWYPPFVLTNPASDTFRLEKTSYRIKYNSTGHATFRPGSLMESMCSIDVTKWPYDQQICSLYFTVQGYSSDQIELVLKGVRLGLLGENGEWELITTDTVNENAFNGFIQTGFSFTLKRRPSFLMMSFVLPFVFLMFLSPFIFFLPAESGERMGYALTILLSVTVFFGSVTQFLPMSSRTIANVTIYLFTTFIANVALCFANLLSLKLHLRENSEDAPSWITRLFSNCSKSQNGVAADEDAVIDLKSNKPQEDKTDSKSPADVKSWKEIANVLDIFLFVFFSVTIACSTFWVLLSILT